MCRLRRRVFVSTSVLTLCLLVLPSLAQTSVQGATSRAASQAKSQQTEPTCTNNGTYTSSNGQTVKRPETCSTAPQGATAQCRDGSYSFSQSHRGTCSHHFGVAKWL
jgi:hypothetical protein